MIGSSLSRLQGLSRALLIVTATTAVFTAGCSNMATTALGSGSTTGAVTGRIHGGNQPVSGAAVTLWFAGQGSSNPASSVSSTTSASDGSFTLPAVNCPSSGNTNPLVYVVAVGGNTVNSSVVGTNNSASVFVAPYGPCANITSSSFVDMSEVTTVATMAALQQYFNPANETFSTDGSGLSKTAMTNAFLTIPNLVNLANGTAVTSLSLAGGTVSKAGQGYSGTATTAIPESAKINLLANILASCINNASVPAANCTTLFNNATPPNPATTSRPYGTTFTTATDVLQAIYYILTNPTNGSSANLTNLFNLSSAAGAPFTPALPTAPSDWTIAIAYTSNSTCGGTSHLINSVQDIAVDTFGQIWLANNETGGNLTALAANGSPDTCIQIGTGANTGVTIDSLAGVSSISNVWIADNGSTNLYRYKPGATTALAFPTVGSTKPIGIAADGSGDIFYSANDSNLYEIIGAPGATTAVTPVSIASAIGPTPAHVFVDNQNSVWSTSGSTFVTRSTSSTPTFGTGYTSAQFTTPGPTYGISVTAISGSKNFVYISADGSSNSLLQYQGVGTSYAETTSGSDTGLPTPTSVASDGAQNVWTVGHTGNAVTELSSAFVPLSPTGGFQKAASYLASGRSIAIDQAGNVWIGLDGANTVAEIVGAAVPVFQPYSSALKAGGSVYFQTIP